MSPKAGRIPWAFLALGLGLCLLLWLLRNALAPFFVAGVLAYLMDPLVRRLSRRMPRGLAAFLVILGGLVLTAGLIWLLVPFLSAQLGRVWNSLPAWKLALEHRLEPWLLRYPVLAAKALEAVSAIEPSQFLTGLRIAGLGLFNGFLRAMTLVLVPVVLFYLLEDGRSLLVAMDSLVPVRYREQGREALREIHERLGGYIRGQLLVSATMSLLQWLGFQAFGLPYAWLLGLIAGISNVVPYSPYVTALVPALILQAVHGAGWAQMLGLAVTFTAIQKIEALYLTPVWVGRASKLHPLEVLLAVLSFGFAFGLLGLVFAVPLMIVVKVLGAALLEAYRRHPWYRGEAS